MKGYKAFNADMTCQGFRYEVGKEYEMDDCELCSHGFHFCENIADCFKYYNSADTRFAVVEAYGDIQKSTDDSKCVTNKIRIVKEIPHDEAVAMSNTGNRNTGNCNTGNWNTGNRNTGYWNTGYRNTGNRNTGYWNTGYRNTGNRNTGNWNTGDRNTGDSNTGDRNTGDRNTGDSNTGDWNTINFSTGCFCTEEQKILLFDQPSDMTYIEWYNSEAAEILRQMPQEIDIVEWIPSPKMTEDEKTEHPTHETTGGYLKVSKSNADKQAWWDSLSDDDKETVKAIPNFDAEKFYKCTGVRV